MQIAPQIFKSAAQNLPKHSASCENARPQNDRSDSETWNCRT